MLEVKGLSVTYGKVVAVRDVSFSVPLGGITALLGANGAGKTSTLLAIAGALKPLGGEILWDERPIQTLSPRQRVHLGIALVPEGRRVFPQLSTIQNLRVGYTGAKKQSQRRTFRDTVEWLLDMFPQLKQRRSAPAGSLSGGEQQMLAIARALASQPRLLLVDELSLGLGPLIVERLFDVMRQLVQQEALTLLLVEQYVEHALNLASYSYILQKGSVLAHGTSEQLLEEGVLASSYLGKSKTVNNGLAPDA